MRDSPVLIITNSFSSRSTFLRSRYMYFFLTEIYMEIWFFTVSFLTFMQRKLFSAVMESIQCKLCCPCTGFCRTAQDCTLSLLIHSACTPCGPSNGDWILLTGRDCMAYEYIDGQWAYRRSCFNNLSMVCFLCMYTYSATSVSLLTQRFGILSSSFKMRWLRPSCLRYCMFTN